MVTTRKRKTAGTEKKASKSAASGKTSKRDDAADNDEVEMSDGRDASPRRSTRSHDNAASENVTTASRSGRSVSPNKGKNAKKEAPQQESVVKPTRGRRAKKEEAVEEAVQEKKRSVSPRKGRLGKKTEADDAQPAPEEKSVSPFCRRGSPMVLMFLLEKACVKL